MSGFRYISSEMTNSKSVYLISCVSQKMAAPTQAKDLYTSAWFLKARRYVESTGCPWFILSAQHGLLRPDQIIGPYDKTLNRMPIQERRIWARNVFAQMDDLMPDVRRIIIFAGKRYREFLTDNLRARGVALEIPLEGLRIGEQLSWLSKHQAHGPAK